MKKFVLLLILLMALSACTDKPEDIDDFIVSFHSNGGTVIADLTVEENGMIQIPDAPTKEGYEFKGWYSDSALNNSVNFSIVVAGDLDVYAKWEINSYKLKFLDFDGSVIYMEPFDYNSSLTDLTVSDPVREGYSFDGWSMELPESMPSSDLELTATYSINTYLVSYVDYDGTVLSSKTFEYGGSVMINVPANPSRDGYDFTGWSETLPSIMPGEDVVISATYDIRTFIMTFLDHNGLWLSSEEFVYGEYMSNIEEPIAEMIEGYTFVGWGIDLMVLNVDDDIVAQATYEINSYTLTFSDYDASILYTYTFEYGEGLSSLSIDEPIRQGYAFIFWDKDIPEVMPSEDILFTAVYMSDRQVMDDEGEVNDYFGLKTYTAGDYIIVTSHSRDDFTGTIWVYKNSDETYVREINGINTSVGTWFGEYIQIHGDYLVVRSTKDNANTGSLWVYKLSDETYERQIIGSDSIAGDYFGTVVVLDGDYIITVSLTPNDNYQGVVYVYKFSDEEYERKIIGTGVVNYSRFGSLIKTDGDNLFIGTIYHNSASGGVWMYKLSDEGYERVIIPNAISPQDYFGRTIEVSGDYVVIGSDGFQTYKGAIWVYKISDPLYERLIVGTGRTENCFFGSSIKIDNDFIIVNVPRLNINIGGVYLYKLSDPSYERLITGVNTGSEDWFGMNIVIENDYLIVFCMDYNNHQGAIWVYKFNDEGYERQIIGEGTMNDSRFASNVLINEDYIIVGSGNYNTQQGAVWIYQFSDENYERKIEWTGTTPSRSFGSSIDLFYGYILVPNYAILGEEGSVAIYDLEDDDFMLILEGNAADNNQYYGAIITCGEDYFIVSNYGYDEKRGKIYIHSLDYN